MGTSDNVVKTRIAITVYVLVAIIKKQLQLEHSLYTILKILSITHFEKEAIYQALASVDYKSEEETSYNQLF